LLFIIVTFGCILLKLTSTNNVANPRRLQMIQNSMNAARIVDFHREQAHHSRSDLDTTRLDWCEANLNHFGWIGTRVVIEDHAGVSDSAATFRRAIDVAMARAPLQLGDIARIEHCSTSGSPNSSAIDLTALRYKVLVDLVTGKDAQQFLTDMCWDGHAPTPKHLEAKLDKMIAAAR
jgi:hypothetical protein